MQPSSFLKHHTAASYFNDILLHGKGSRVNEDDAGGFINTFLFLVTSLPAHLGESLVWTLRQLARSQGLWVLWQLEDGLELAAEETGIPLVILRSRAESCCPRTIIKANAAKTCGEPFLSRGRAFPCAMAWHHLTLM